MVILPRSLLLFVVLQMTNADLPGLFSGTLCSSEQRNIVEPWCTCKSQLNIENNVDSWCKVYADFSECVESRLLGRNNNDSSTVYLSHVFNKTLMDRRMENLCSDGDFPKVEECSKETAACHTIFLNNLNSAVRIVWNEENSCKVSENLTSCLWTDKNCPAKQRHLLAKLADGYTSRRCTKYFKIAVGDQCSSQRRNLFPSKTSMESCLKGVQFQMNCMSSEVHHSLHNKDRFYNLEADRLNIYVYETFRCEHYNKYRNLTCFNERSEAADKCLQRYVQTERNFVSAIKHGRTISIKDVCGFHHNMTKCFQEAQPDCKPKSDYIVALICTALPKSCECPIKRNKEYADGFYQASKSAFSELSVARLTVLIYAMVAVWNHSI